MDIIARLRDYIKANVSNLNADIVSPLLSGEPKSIAIKLIPSSPNSLHIDDNGTYDISLQISVKDPDSIRAGKVIQDIFNALRYLGKDAFVSNNNSFKLLKLQAYSMPHWIDRTEKGEHIFTAMFVAEIELL